IFRRTAMRTSGILFTLLIFSSLIGNIAIAVEKDTELEKVTLKVEGMTCIGCAVAVQSALEKVQGVRNAEVSFRKGEAVVEFEKGKVNTTQLIEAVEKVGYKAYLLDESEIKVENKNSAKNSTSVPQKSPMFKVIYILGILFIVYIIKNKFKK
ncbi:MAG: heavy-metal-associated domain-containing protein, partial [Methanosarcinales archaeon]